MASVATVTMIAPDGTPGDIPQDRVQDAVKAGFKQAVSMTSPDGKTGYIPADRQQDALTAGFKPTAPQADTRSLFQKAKDNFNANTQGAKPGEGPITSFVHDFSAGGGDAVRAIAHPIRTIESMASTPDAALAAVAHFAGGDTALNKIASQPPTSVARALGQAGTGAILGEAAGAVAGPAVEGAASAKAKLYPTSQSLVPAVSAARNLSKALVVDPAGVNNFVKAATDEAGTIRGYAQDNGLPINSKIDFANAAKQTADAVQDHFDANILEPSAKKVVAVPASYQGPTVGEGNNATLGAINDRINSISSELKSNYRKPLQAQTSAANTSDADLLSEKQALTNVLHKQLGAATGLPPEAIADLRTQAGKLRTIADESQLSANRDLTASGKQDMGATTSAVGTKTGLIDRALQTAQGGPEIIGNRNLNNALKKVEPRSLTLPAPNPVDPIVAERPAPIAGASTPYPTFDPTPNVSTTEGNLAARNAAKEVAATANKAAAQAEFLKAQELQQSAQDASLQRGSQAQDARLDKRAAVGPNLWSSQGYAKVVNHLELDPSSGIGRADLVNFGLTPGGKSLLIRASTLSPGSPAMRNLVTKIADQIRAQN